MSPCAMAGPQCPRVGVVLIRIDGVGDRKLCLPCIASLERMGVAFRRLDAEAVVPEWRQRSLRRDFSRSVA
jgi:hypothetical protein